MKKRMKTLAALMLAASVAAAMSGCSTGGTTDTEATTVESTAETESEITTEAESETATETESETVTEAESETATETESETAAETESETETETEAESEITAETESETATEAESETETDSEATTETESEIVTEAESETATEAESETAAETESETETETEAESETTAETESETATEAESETAAETESETVTEAESETATETESETATEAESETAAETESETATEAESETETVTESETEAESETAAETETEAESESAAETDSETEADTETGEKPGEGQTLRVAMECVYAPYNWTQPDDANGAVPISGSSDYANGYDVMMAKHICEELGYELEIVKLDWDSLVPAVQSGNVDCAIAGQSITSQRQLAVDFSEPYYYASIVTLVKADGEYADAQSVEDLAGATCTSQQNTVWYDTCLPQIPDANILAAQDSAPAMLVALDSGRCDLVVTDMPTALAACVAYPDFELLDFSGTDGDFEVSDEEINIGISIQKGNTELLDQVNSVLDDMTEDDYAEMMDEAISIQPLSE